MLAEKPLFEFELSLSCPFLPPVVSVKEDKPRWVKLAKKFFEPGLFLKYRGMLYLVSVQIEIQDKLL